jgi:ubiquinone biosynthesis protein COQ4
MLRETWLKARVISAFAKLVKDPNRLNEVFAIADSLSEVQPEVVTKMRDDFARDPDGARALREKPRMGRMDLDALGRLPEGTLGRVFADHMRKNKIDPSDMPNAPSTTEFEFIRAHLYETHDVWHVVTGFRNDVADELGLQAFYLTQIEGTLPTILLALGFLNTAIYSHDERDRRMSAIVRGWLMGKRSKRFFGAEWAKMWAMPLAEVRRRYAIDVDAIDALLPSVTLATALSSAA